VEQRRHPTPPEPRRDVQPCSLYPNLRHPHAGVDYRVRTFRKAPCLHAYSNAYELGSMQKCVVCCTDLRSPWRALRLVEWGSGPGLLSPPPVSGLTTSSAIRSSGSWYLLVVPASIGSVRQTGCQCSSVRVPNAAPSSWPGFGCQGVIATPLLHTIIPYYSQRSWNSVGRAVHWSIVRRGAEACTLAPGPNQPWCLCGRHLPDPSWHGHKQVRPGQHCARGQPYGYRLHSRARGAILRL
jgi:hypothetical protein